jgi:hypothetical protein
MQDVFVDLSATSAFERQITTENKIIVGAMLAAAASASSEDGDRRMSLNRIQAIRDSEVHATVFFTSKIHVSNSLKNDHILRSDVMRSYGISGHFELVRLVKRQFDSLSVQGCINLYQYSCVYRYWNGFDVFEFIVISILRKCTSSLVLLHVPGSNPQPYLHLLKGLGPNYEGVRLLAL